MEFFVVIFFESFPKTECFIALSATKINLNRSGDRRRLDKYFGEKESFPAVWDKG